MLQEQNFILSSISGYQLDNTITAQKIKTTRAAVTANFLPGNIARVSPSRPSVSQSFRKRHGRHGSLQCCFGLFRVLFS